MITAAARTDGRLLAREAAMTRAVLRGYGLRPLTTRSLVGDLVLAVALLVAGLLPLPLGLFAPGPLPLAVGAGAVALRRLHPSAAMALAWAAVLLQLVGRERPSLVQVSTLIVVYSAAAWGRRSEVGVAAASVVVGGALATPYLTDTGARFRELMMTATPDQRVLVGLLPFAVLGSAWLAGVAVRATRSRRHEAVRRSAAEVRADAAQETAAVERVRSAMAREVHDVVGHSLAVIIAQADAAELTEDPARARRMVADIARTARTSLAEVRTVLERTGGEQEGGFEEDLDEVLARVRATGAELEDRETGIPVPLAPPVALVARRLLQEMLTNALRHGRPGGLIEVQRDWRPTALVLSAANERGPLPNPGSGHGLSGMRARLQAVGGTFETDVLGDRFVVRARIPLEEVAP